MSEKDLTFVKRIDQMDVLDAIDRPIRDLVIHINRIGLPTVFSCCGYPYPDEEEPKSHAYKNAYVIFKKPTCGKSYAAFDALTYRAFKNGWSVGRYSDDWRIDLKLDKSGSPSGGFYIQDEQDRDSYSLHDYEMLSLGIWNMTEALKDIESISDEVRVVDGNRTYHKLGIDWQIKPKPDVILQFKEEGEAPQE